MFRVVNNNKMMLVKTESTSEERKGILDSRGVAQQLALADRAWSVRERLEEERLLAASHEEVLDGKVEDEDEGEDEKRDDASGVEQSEQSRASRASRERKGPAR